MQIKIKKVRDHAILPEYQSAQAAGFDFHAAIDQPIIIAPGKSVAIPTGLAVELPVGHELQIRPRSGLAFKYDVTMLNGIGTIDADYRGEMSIKLINFGQNDFVVEPNMRVAQGVIARHEVAQWLEVDELSETERGSGGLGSTGL